MSDPVPKSRPARLFIALELPAEIRAAIGRWGKRELRDASLRRLPEDALHLTLVFLGDTPAERIRRIAAVLIRLGGTAPRIEFAPQPLSLPRGRPPGLYALEARSERLVQIQAELEAALAAEGLHRPERRPFSPHVTVARVRRGGGRARKPRPVERPPGPLPDALREPFDAVRFGLYLSSFRPGGVDYSSLAQVELPAGAAAVR